MCRFVRCLSGHLSPRVLLCNLVFFWSLVWDSPQYLLLSLLNGALLVVFTYTRWLLSWGITFLPDARGSGYITLSSGYIFLLIFRSLSDIFILWRVSDEKSFRYVKRMLQLFRAVDKFYVNWKFWTIAIKISIELLEILIPVMKHCWNHLFENTFSLH